MSKSIQLKNKNNEKMYPNPYYPVGSIYLSVIDVNPTTWFGGTWEKIAKGRTLVGVDTNDTDFNTVKKTGGEKKHTLNVNEMPSHSHKIKMENNGKWNWNHGAESGDKVNGNTYVWNSGSVTYNYLVDNEPVGGSQAHNNLQPYFTCYIWCRTA